MIKKIAFFVEGHTEQTFISRLISEVLTSNTFSITKVEFSGSIKARKITIINATKITGMEKYYFMIYNCRGDSAVKSDIIERYNSLAKASYDAIIGIRDVYPENNLLKTRKYLNYGLPNPSNIKIRIILAIMEIESWFIAEENHYNRISSKLNIQNINTIVGIDITKNTTEVLTNPANDLHNIYKTVSLAYNERSNQVERTVDALDYENLYCEVRKRNSSLNEFLDAFESVI
jgi:hypothetical protein